MKYIGQTKRNLKTRLKEHKTNLKYYQEEKSAIVKHSLQFNHKFSNIKLIKEVQNSQYLDAYETLYIKNNLQNLVNNEHGVLHNSPLLYI